MRRPAWPTSPGASWHRDGGRPGSLAANPLARRLVGMVTAYVVGNGVTLRSAYPPLQRFIDDFWQANRMDLRVAEWCDELSRSGEIFPVLFTNPEDGRSSVRCVPASLIERVTWRDGDYESELAYREQGRVGERGALVVLAPHERTQERATPVMLHYAVNRPVGALRGESDLAPILPWLRRYSPLAGGPGAAQRRGAGLSVGGQGAGPPADGPAKSATASRPSRAP